MPRHFNVAGPCDPEIHHLVPIHPRLPDVMQLIDTRAYWPRPSFRAPEALCNQRRFLNYSEKRGS